MIRNKYRFQRYFNFINLCRNLRLVHEVRVSFFVIVKCEVSLSGIITSSTTYRHNIQQLRETERHNRHICTYFTYPRTYLARCDSRSASNSGNSVSSASCSSHNTRYYRNTAEAEAKQIACQRRRLATISYCLCFLLYCTRTTELTPQSLLGHAGLGMVKGDISLDSTLPHNI